jgi:hypothetical protein
MKSFEQFLKEEISIKGNKGVPSEKITDIESRGAEKIRGANPQQLMSQIMGFLRQSQSFTKGKEKELEKLAKEVIEDAFGLVLANVDLDINMVKDGNKIAEFMKKEEEEKREEEESQEEEEEEEEEESPEIDLEAQPSEEEIKLAVDKRKLVNNFIQGEAKNTKHILHSDKCKQGLERIYGAKWREIFDIWDNMSKIADKLDWIIPIQHKADMMENAPGGMAGCVSCRFPKKKKKEKSKSDEELANDVLKSLEDGEDIMNKQEDIKKLLGVTKPTIKARGIDFPMLLHETVKGIYEMIADVAMPKGKKLATEVHKQTSSFADEAEDFRYGPYLAQDLTDFIAKNSKVDEYPNVKEYVFGKLIDSDRWSDEECLLNLKNVFLESPEGRQLIDSLIDETIEELDEYNNQMAEWKAKTKDYEDSKKNEPSLEEPSLEEVPEWWKEEDGKSEESESEEVDYSKMSKRDVQKLLDDRLEELETAETEEEKKIIYDDLNKLSSYLTKEGKIIYSMEIERINESHKFHTRIK